MKELRSLVKAAVLSVFVLFIAGCGTTQQWTADTGARFHEADSADVVLRFSEWDHISIERPVYREGGFVRHFRREELNPAFDRLRLRRGTAVVVVGWTYRDEMLNIVVNDWKSVLRECGFQRVVCLRGTSNSQINGLRILDDSKLASTGTGQSATQVGGR